LKTLITRAITGSVFLVVVIGAILTGPNAFTILCLLFAVIGLNEYTKFKPELFSKTLNHILFIFTGLIVFLSLSLPSLELLPFRISIWGFSIILICLVYVLVSEKKKPFAYFSEFLFGLIYVAIPFALLASFHFLNDLRVEDYELLIGFFIILWCNDVFAYLVGSAIGKTKLAVKISPKKTWEGTIGGAVLSILSAFIISKYFFISLDVVNWLVLGLLISIFATLGDLLESKFKRQAGIKDSGKIMPGHGGVLDRFDGMILAAPVVYIYLSIVL